MTAQELLDQLKELDRDYLPAYTIRIDPESNKIIITNNYVGAFLDNNKWYPFICSNTELTTIYTKLTVTGFRTLKSALIHAIEKYLS